MIRVSTAPRKRNSPRIAEKSAPAFLRWLRGRECLAFSPICLGKIEAAHVDYAGGKGMGTKVADRHAIPLCSAHHRLQHANGWPWFDIMTLRLAGAGEVAAAKYWRAWPGRIAWERKLADG